MSKSVKDISYHKNKRTNIPCDDTANITKMQPAEKFTKSSSIYFREQIEPKLIISSLLKKTEIDKPQFSFFESSDWNLDIESHLEAYEHNINWANRMILGDSAQIMGSLIEREKLRGKVQCIYFDPPYGINFNANWKPKLGGNDPKQKLSQESEVIKAYRDCWKNENTNEYDINQYLVYLEKRLRLMHEMLTETGSIFLQISDENVHKVRTLLDKIFKEENFVLTIPVKTKNTPINTSNPEGLNDYLLWYAKTKENTQGKRLHKYNKLFIEKNIEGNSIWRFIGYPDGSYDKMTPEQINNHSLLKEERKRRGRIFRGITLESIGEKGENRKFPITYQGRTFHTKKGWMCNEDMMTKLADENMLLLEGNSIQGRYYFDFFPIQALASPWMDTNLGNNKQYPVQTASKVIERCILMTTNPGDLVFDPTCGAGTTAYAAEKWGRRWITCDTSRVAVAIARKRITEAKFDWYKYRDPENKDISQGFKYKTVPHISLGDFAENPAILDDPPHETLFDQPETDSKIVRVSGPFTIESIVNATIYSTDGNLVIPNPNKLKRQKNFTQQVSEALKTSGIRIPNQEERVHLFNLKEIHSKYITFIGNYKNDKNEEKTAAIFLGPEDAPITENHTLAFAKEAEKFTRQSDAIKIDVLISVGFSFNTGIQKNDFQLGEFKAVQARISSDLQIAQIKHKPTDNSVTLVGEPEVILHKAEKGMLQVEIKGIDIFNPITNEIKSTTKDTGEVACWSIDPNYNEKCFHARHIYFPYDKKNVFKQLKSALNAQISEEAWATLHTTKSQPFSMPAKGNKIAVRAMSASGEEVTKLLDPHTS